jgi:hypothetical protein
MSRLVVLAVFVIASAALVDAIRPDGREGAVPAPTLQSEDGQPLVSGSAGLVVAENRVLRDGKEYLSAEQIKDAFPAPLAGSSFDLAHVAASPDGLVALATYNFPYAGAPMNSVELWRNGELLVSFAVPPGSFGGGLAFSQGGHLVATVSPDGRLATLFDRRGRRVDTVPVTRW